MKYRIFKVELVCANEEVFVLRNPIYTDDIEEKRAELHRAYNCDRVLLSYEEVE